MNIIHSIKAGVLATLLTISAAGYAHNSGSNADNKVMGQARAQLLGENPWLLQQLALGGGFGGNYSRAIANHMYSRTNKAALTDARDKLVVKKIAQRTWALIFPIVTVIAFETDAGFVLFDSGYAPAGPAIKDALARISDKPIHSIVISHFHIDHALGAWALIEDQYRPQIITTREFLRQQQRDIDLNYYMTQRTHQAYDTTPQSWDDVVRPTRVFDQTLTLTVGGEDFVITAARGETADQLYMHAPKRNIITVADYYQRFIPNAGNGRRPTRYVAEWAQALSDMAALEPEIMVPAHGPIISDPQEIQDRLRAHAAILASVDQQVRDALNADTPEYLIADSIQMPAQYRNRDDVDERYVSLKDVAKMALHQYTGWWNDMPSSWDPTPVKQLASEIVAATGGVDKVIARAYALVPNDIRSASYFIDQAWLAQPNKPKVLQAVYSIYLHRLRGNEPLQEALVYLDHLSRIRMALNARGIAPQAKAF